MNIVYISGDTIVLEATTEELKKIKGDANYTPAVDDEINVAAAYDSWLWICSKKAQIDSAGENLKTLAAKLP